MTETMLERRPESSQSEKRASKAAWKKPWVLIAALLVLACAITAIVYAFSGSSAPKPATPHNPPATSAKGKQPLAAPGVADIGKPFSDGSFSFSVVGYNCSTVTPQGKICLVHVEATNTTSSAQTLTADGQQLFGAKGDAYKVDTANKASATLLRKFAAGESTTGDLAFNVPADTQLKKVELHGAPASQGAIVTLP